MIIIWRLSRSAVEKSLISFLMASGLFASAVGIIKIYYLATFDVKSPDTWRDMIPQFLWCRVEEIILIIAACAPLLKPTIERLLYRLGLPAFQNTPRQLNCIQSRPDDSESKQSDPEQGGITPTRTRSS